MNRGDSMAGCGAQETNAMNAVGRDRLDKAQLYAA